ncbi:hypothetical protein FOQG_16472 [Fusarium oxysporum f. sp. raphani 54005]|uniref:Uncharacterized protein n=2 Tax=Fusarium oxysporum f. sp. raphani TaxID=96318 RepID=X0BJ36_FUSOX|nr:hypothetical protein FOQG_16472 [Fusarium oxysporum f. sp. raphani 54005]KAG7413376.1 hypothetical protein Forpi1262_v016989 [Fusarium oxysporum f. sp. raphani]
MPAPQCGLPPPATMTLPSQQPPTAISPPMYHAPPPRLPPPSLTQSHQQRDSWPQFSSPPQQWQAAEEYMRNWLQAKVEEDKRRREEERTRQESLRLEQRKVEMDMLCTSLQGGIPPAMIPLIFVRMGSGGVRPQMAGPQQLTSVSQAYHHQLLSPQHAHPKRQRDISQPTQAAAPAMASHPQIQQVQSSQQESQPSSSITFYNWQPPISQAGSSSNRPGTPSASTKTKRQ